MNVCEAVQCFWHTSQQCTTLHDRHEEITVDTNSLAAQPQMKKMEAPRRPRPRSWNGACSIRKTKQTSMRSEAQAEDEDAVLHAKGTNKAFGNTSSKHPATTNTQQGRKTTTQTPVVATNASRRCAQTCATAQWGCCKMQEARPLAGTPTTARNNSPVMGVTSVSLKTFQTQPQRGQPRAHSP